MVTQAKDQEKSKTFEIKTKANLYKHLAYQLRGLILTVKNFRNGSVESVKITKIITKRKT